jgi:hypothetical protein
MAYEIFMTRMALIFEGQGNLSGQGEGSIGKPRRSFPMPKSPYPESADCTRLIACDAVPYVLGPHFQESGPKDSEPKQTPGQLDSFVALIAMFSWNVR